jgi:hypothetical protein
MLEQSDENAHVDFGPDELRSSHQNIGILIAILDSGFAVVTDRGSNSCCFGSFREWGLDPHAGETVCHLFVGLRPKRFDSTPCCFCDIFRFFLADPAIVFGESQNRFNRQRNGPEN